MPPVLGPLLALERCPFCSLHTPKLERYADFQSMGIADKRRRHWAVYVCANCGNATLAMGETPSGVKQDTDHVKQTFPAEPAEAIPEELPEKARVFLKEAVDSPNAPNAACMVIASALDEMLKAKGLTNGSLYSRIESATKGENPLLTDEMRQWAHDIRLDANDQRHADTEAAHSTQEDHHRQLEFAKMLGHILYVLPARVKRGIDRAQATGKAARAS